MLHCVRDLAKHTTTGAVRVSEPAEADDDWTPLASMFAKKSVTLESWHGGHGWLGSSPLGKEADEGLRRTKRPVVRIALPDWAPCARHGGIKQGLPPALGSLPERLLRSRTVHAAGPTGTSALWSVFGLVAGPSGLVWAKRAFSAQPKSELEP
jgi:hypothetical protein